jgi:hypothetical protein
MSLFLQLAFLLTIILLSAKLAGLELHLGEMKHNLRVAALAGLTLACTPEKERIETGMLLVLPVLKSYGLYETGRTK